MARTIQQISDSLVSELVKYAASVGITINPKNWSKTDYKKLILDSVAIGSSITEQLQESYIQDIEEIASSIPPATSAYIKSLMMNVFEYNSITNPVFQLKEGTLVPCYPNPNPNNRIIKYCSVVRSAPGKVTIKVAAQSNSLPSKIVAPELLAAQTFANNVLVPGIVYDVVSLDADRLFMQLDVYYTGVYDYVIKSNVKLAINNYLASIGFDGKIILSDLFVKIKLVSGVVDCVFVNVKNRPYSTVVGGGTSLVLNNTEVQKDLQTIAGYLVLEDTSGANWTLDDYRVGSSGIKNLNLISV